MNCMSGAGDGRFPSERLHRRPTPRDCQRDPDGRSVAAGNELVTSVRVPFSAVIISRNAARELPACLDSVAFADEIVVVDTASTDGTAELAAARGARVIQREWHGFGRQKQFAVAQARHEWVLCLDADERVS